MNNILYRLSRSKFRSSFHLSQKDKEYIQAKGLDTIRAHCTDFVHTRLAPADPANDGKQTPYRGHPVFTAQHATATCCRTGVAKWHKIPQGRPMTTQEENYITELIMAWIRSELTK